MIAPGNGGKNEGLRPAHDGERLYALVSSAVGARAFERVQGEFSTHIEIAKGTTRTYYDTFDGRLAAAHQMLCAVEGAGERELRLESTSGRLTRRLVTNRVPAFAEDLPAGPFRDAIAPQSGIRKLLPVATVKGDQRRLSVLSKQGKTTVRLALEAWTPHGGRSRAPKLALLRLSPVRGYPKPLRAVIDVLEGELGLRPLPGSALAEMLGVGGAAQDDAPAWPPDIDDAMRTDEATLVIYRGLFATMQANEAGTRARTDPEFLHEYRVALRRTRAGLARLKGVFPERTIDRFKREFKWLGGVTGPVRDMDVQLLEIPSYEEDLDADAREHLDPLKRWVADEGNRAQAQLVKAFASARYTRLMTAWAQFLDKPLPTRTQQPDARRPVTEVARERIWKLHNRIVKRGLAIDDDTPAESVHDLRLDAKKLRYLMEFFRRLFPTKQIKTQIAALKQLQEVLGRFNDFEVQQGKLQHAATAMSVGGRVPLDAVLVMGRLVESLRRRQMAARAEIQGRVQAFAQPENLERAAALFAPRRQEQPA